MFYPIVIVFLFSVLQNCGHDSAVYELAVRTSYQLPNA